MRLIKVLIVFISIVLIGCGQTTKYTVEEVIDLIDNAEVNEAQSIELARNAYDSLTNQEKNEVINYIRLLTLEVIPPQIIILKYVQVDMIYEEIADMEFNGMSHVIIDVDDLIEKFYFINFSSNELSEFTDNLFLDHTVFVSFYRRASYGVEDIVFEYNVLENKVQIDGWWEDGQPFEANISELFIFIFDTKSPIDFFDVRYGFRND